MLCESKHVNNKALYGHVLIWSLKQPFAKKRTGNLVKYNTGNNNNVLSKAKKKNNCVSANML